MKKYKGKDADKVNSKKEKKEISHLKKKKVKFGHISHVFRYCNGSELQKEAKWLRGFQPGISYSVGLGFHPS